MPRSQLGCLYGHYRHVPSPRWAYHSQSGDLSELLTSLPRGSNPELTLEKVDVVDLEALQASLNRVEDVLRKR